jgi:hypothetical protein
MRNLSSTNAMVTLERTQFGGQRNCKMEATIAIQSKISKYDEVFEKYDALIAIVNISMEDV